MSMLKDYFEEIESKSVIETDKGFATYMITGDECYIEDVYIKPEFRGNKEIYKIADKITEIAKEAGCSLLTGSVIPSYKTSTISALVLINYGMKIHSSRDNFIAFYKEIK